MPKSIIREFDNSTTGSILSSNFSVLVPGYMNPEKDTEELKELAKTTGIYYEDSKIYVLNSQAVFTKFIGKYGGNKEPVAPEPEILHPELTGIQKYQTQLTIEKVRDYYWNEKTIDYKYYVGTSVATTDSDYGKNGYLLKTFTLETGNETYKFTPVKAKDLVEEFENPNELVTETAGVYFKIKNSKVGATNTSVDHIGNQIAYELLGLGYTVYFKVLSTDSPALDQLSKPAFWEPLKQKSVYRVRYLTSGGCYDSNVVKEMQKIAYVNNKAKIEDADVYGNEIGRGDVIVLADIDESATDIVNATTKDELLRAFGNEAAKFSDNGEKGKGKFTAVFAPRVAYDFGYSEDDVYSNDQLFPASFHYLACAAYAQERYAEWYAVAGYTRGICGKPIKYLTKTFGDVDVNTLCPRVANNYAKVAAVNLIITERGNYYLWGNRTAEPLPLTDKKGLIFSHFLNIRQLCCTLKQVLYEATRKFTFEPNSDLLWINFVNAIKPTLEAMKADQGISGYKISRVATDKKALLVAKIRIVPIEAVEDFDISIYLEDSLSGIIVDADETVAE